MFHQGFCFHYGSHYQATTKDRSFQMDSRVPTCLGRNQAHYMDALILISFHWDLEFHVHTNAFNLVVGAMLA